MEAPNVAACCRSRSPFDPAARAMTFSLSGCARTTPSVLCPIDPVDPSIASLFIPNAGLQAVRNAGLRAMRSAGLQAGLETVPDENVVHGRREQQRVDPVEHAAMTGNQGGCVLHIDAALQQRLE